jgi:hypothetical protein
MFDWFASQSHRLVYFGVIYIPVLILLIAAFSGLNLPLLMPVAVVYFWLIFPLSSLWGVIMLVEGTSRLIRKKSANYLLWIGFATLLLNIIILMVMAAGNQ